MTTNTMKALTLWQPWASLIALGLKQYETRSWSTSYRGLLAIHAARRPMRVLDLTDEIRGALESRGATWETIPVGAVLCVVRLVDVMPTEHVVALAEQDPRIRDQELAFGNYGPDRFAWQLELIRVAPEPIPARGAQGLWTWQYE